MKRTRFVLSLLFVVLAFATLTAWRFLSSPAILDDAFISFRYSSMLASGNGLVFNPEDGRIEGFTNLSWVLINALVIWCGGNPVQFSQIAGLLAFVAAFGLVFSVGMRLAGGAGAVSALLVGLVMIVLPDLVAIFGSGLETSFAALLTTLLAWSLIRSRVSPWNSGIIAAILMLTRPDGAIFASAAALSGFIASRQSSQNWRHDLGRHLAAWGAVAAIPSGGILLFRLLYFGESVPNTYYAKNADVASWSAGTSYLTSFAASYAAVVGLVAIWLGLRIVQRRLRPVDLFGAVSIALYAVYVCRVGGDFMSYRFMFQIVPLISFLAVASLEGHEGLLRPVVVCFIGALLIYAWATPAKLEEKYGMQSMQTMTAFVGPGTEVGLALGRSLPRSTRISTTLAGTIPYYSGLFVIDEWGLNDKQIARAPSVPIPEKGRGHMKRASPAYLDRRGVNLELGHPVICGCRELCDDAFPQVYLRLDENRCLRMRYRVSTPELTRLFCESSLFRTLHIDCQPEPLPQWTVAEVRETGAPSDVGRWSAVDPHQLLAGAHGVAFGSQPSNVALPGQSKLEGHSGLVINSFHGGDSTTGWISISVPKGVTRIKLRVGGGGLDGVFVGLVGNGSLLARASGLNTETLREVEFSVPSSNDLLELVVMDREVGPWGHVLVSDVFWGFAE